MAIHALKADYMLGEYRIERLLGEGGFGLTYLAFDTNLEKQVAIKEYMPSEHAVRKDSSQIVAKSKSSETVYNWGLNAFLNEAKTLAKFEDSNIVRIYRFFKANGTAYIVMEYCEGGCLIDRVSKNVHMPEKQLIQIISSIVHGLQLVHDDGILHRDIKPDNIMFRLDGTPVLIDFGAARQAIGSKSRKVTTIITPGYAPLEQYSSNGIIGPWSDIYSLSAVAYLCITGKRPPDIMNRLHEDTIEKLSQRVNSSAFFMSIDKGLELQVNDRPQSLSEWSSNWSDLSFTEKEKSKKWQPSLIPIYANKELSSGNNTVGSPISARTSLEAYEQTIVNAKSVELDSKKKSGFSKFLFIILLLGVIVAGGYFGYEFYLNQQKQKLELAKQDEQRLLIEKQQEQQQRDLILQVQQILNKLNYKVPENGNIDTRTTESIKLFESKQNMIVTGIVDAPLLKELLQAVNGGDESAWKAALSQHSVKGYEVYLIEQPNGAYKDQVPILITEIKSVEQKKLDLIELQKTEDIKATALAAQLKQDKLNQIAAQKRKLIQDIQLVLKQLKFKNINTDGILDRNSKSAIKAYQKIKKVEQTGIPSKTLLFLLRSDKTWPGRQVGESFTDCDECPNMVVISAGNYMMGSTKGKDNEKPPHNVMLNEFIVSETEVTFNQWNACVNDNGCTHNPVDDELIRDNQAVMHINMNDIKQYLTWINEKSSRKYRLPSEAEWEYVARAGTTTAYSWGDEIGNNNASCQGCNTGVDNIINKVKMYPANAYGIYDMHGNVWEWTADCWHPNYYGAPSDNLPWEPNGCTQFVVRGGSGGNPPDDLRSASRGVMQSDKRLNSLGFRVAMDSD